MKVDASLNWPYLANAVSDADARVPSSASLVGFKLFLLLNAVLFIRPAEIIPALEALPIYEVVIIACMLFSIPVVLRQLTLASFATQPGVVCVLMLLPAILLSHLLHGRTYDARIGALVFVKIVLYYLLLLGLLNSTARLRTFLIVLVALIVPLAVLSVLQYHEVIDIPALAQCMQGQGDDEFSGERIILVRLQSLGIFSDPNDFSLILASGLFICIHQFVEHRRIFLRLAWLIPIGILGYAFALTHSRGGFLALLAGLTVYTVSRRGWRRSLLPAVVVLPLLLLAMGGRQTKIDLDDRDDTAQGRILLWRDSMELFRESPVFGIGYGQLAEVNELVAHNSFVHSYAELGLLGGTFFVGAFYCAFLGLHRIKVDEKHKIDPALLCWRPCVLAMTVGYATGLFSLSRCYGVPTYLILGVAGAYGNLVGRDAPSAIERLNLRFLKRLCMVSVICLVVIMAFIKLFAH